MCPSGSKRHNARCCSREHRCFCLGWHSKSAPKLGPDVKVLTSQPPAGPPAHRALVLGLQSLPTKEHGKRSLSEAGGRRYTCVGLLLRVKDSQTRKDLRCSNLALTAACVFSGNGTRSHSSKKSGIFLSFLAHQVLLALPTNYTQNIITYFKTSLLPSCPG